MRTLLAGAALFCAALFVMTDANLAQEKGKAKEVVLKGSITCAKCDLGTADQCETVIVVKKDKKSIVYHFDAASHKKYHDDICASAKPGSVTGTVKDADKKKIVTVKKLTYDK